nr:phosphatase [uncultured Blautia sp.]
MYLSDIHTHSIASGHGTSCTISQMAKAASGKGLSFLGITDHGPATLGAGTVSYFRSLPMAPRKRFGIQLLFSAEVNILDDQGQIDLPLDVLSGLDYVIASMHIQNFRPADRQKNTLALLNAMQHPCVKILGHIDNTQYDLDYEAVIQSAAHNQVLIEVNEASLAPYGYRGDTRDNCRQMLKLCQQYQVPVILSSDSHGSAHVGDFTYGDAFIKACSFPQHLILNNQIPRLLAFLMER